MLSETRVGLLIVRKFELVLCFFFFYIITQFTKGSMSLLERPASITLQMMTTLLMLTLLTLSNMTPWFMNSILSPGDTVLYVGTEKTDPSIAI